MSYDLEYEDAVEDTMAEILGAALAARAQRVTQKGPRYWTMAFEMVIPPHTRTGVTRYPRILFRGQKITVNTVRGTGRTFQGRLHVRGLFVGGRSQRPLNSGEMYSSDVHMDTAEPNTPIMFDVENTSDEPKTFKAEISGIVLEGSKPVDNTRAASSRIRGDSDGAYEFGIDVLGAGPTGFQLKQPSLSLGTPSLSLSAPSMPSAEPPASPSYYPSNPSYASSLNLGTPTLSMPSMSSPTPSAPVSDGSWNPSVLAAPSFQVTPTSQYSINGKRVTKEEFEMVTSPHFWKREAFAGLPVWKVAAGAGGTLALLGLAFLAFRPAAVSGGAR